MSYTVEELLAVALPFAMERLVEAADRRETVSYAAVVRYITPSITSGVHSPGRRRELPPDKSYVQARTSLVTLEVLI